MRKCIIFFKTVISAAQDFSIAPYPAHGKRVALIYLVSRKGVVINMKKDSGSPQKQIP